MTLPGYMTDEEFCALPEKPEPYRICGYTGREFSKLTTIAALMFTGLTVFTLCVVHWQTIVELVR